jgi:hypothetical protein
MSGEERRLTEAGYEREDLPIGVRYVKRCISDDIGTGIIVTVYKYTKRWAEIAGHPSGTPWSVAVSIGVEICFERGKTLDEAMMKAEDKVTSWIAALIHGLEKAQLMRNPIINFSSFKV